MYHQINLAYGKKVSLQFEHLEKIKFIPFSRNKEIHTYKMKRGIAEFDTAKVSFPILNPTLIINTSHKI